MIRRTESSTDDARPGLVRLKFFILTNQYKIVWYEEINYNHYYFIVHTAFN